MQVQSFVTVAQRCILTIEESLLPLFAPLFRIETHMSLEERLHLASLALNLPEGFRACEVGSYLGSSTCFLATAARLKGGRIHCVDVWDNRAMGIEPPRDTFEEFQRNTAALADQLILHRGESARMAPEVPDGLDLLFLDGDHSYPAMLLDLENYVPKLKPGGLLLLHDFELPSVRQGCSEFLSKHPMREGGQAGSLKAFVGKLSGGRS